jgi:hypothetical protein
MSFFDSIQNTVFQITTNTFGDTAIWLPFDLSPEQSGKVLYKDATAKHTLDENDYNIERFVMEYKSEDFTGLFESVARANNEKIKIVFTNGTETNFWVKRCEKVFDGKTIKAFLQPI